MPRTVSGIRVPYFTSVKRRLHFVGSRVKSSMVRVKGCARAAKLLLIVFQVLFWLLGCVALGIVAFWLKHSPELTAMLRLRHAAVPRESLHCIYALIVAGLCVMHVGFAGFYVSFSDSLYLLRALLAVVLGMFVTLVVAGILGFHQRERLAEDMFRYYTEASHEWKNAGCRQTPDDAACKCDPMADWGSPAAACVRAEFHDKLCQRWAQETTHMLRGQTYEDKLRDEGQKFKSCMERITVEDGSGEAFVRERVQATFWAYVKVVSWWAGVLGVVMMLEMVYVVLLMLELRHTSEDAPDLTANPEQLLGHY